MVKRSRRVFLAACAALLILVVGQGDYRPTAVDLAVAPYKYSLIRWELSHFPDKWLRKAGNLLPWRGDEATAQRNTLAQEFFRLGQELSEAERRLRYPGAHSSAGLTQPEDGALAAKITEIKERRRAMQPEVEEAIESEISAALSQEGFASRIGLIFPPVDAVFTGSPAVLVLSPRDRIHRERTILLAPGISDEDRETIEKRVFQEENLSALVENTGGVAVYPSVVSDSASLHHAVVTAAHEWLHHWFFFQPLGQHFWDSAEMTTLNETAATLGGQEIGDRAFTAITGQRMDRGDEAERLPAPGAFDFNAAMRETRLRTEELLAQGRIEEAEAYMEQRRQLMVANGRLVRKINQAFFAFHGSYADSPASISPINGQLKELRQRNGSLEDFLKLVASFGSHQEFLDYLERGRGGLTVPKARWAGPSELPRPRPRCGGRCLPPVRFRESGRQRRRR